MKLHFELDLQICKAISERNAGYHNYINKYIARGCPLACSLVHLICSSPVSSLDSKLRSVIELMSVRAK